MAFRTRLEVQPFHDWSNEKMIEGEIDEKRPLKIGDIAKLAGVSISAVSAAVNNRPQISRATRERVLGVVDKYHYVPQRSARALSTRKSFQIGFLISSKVTLGLANSYFSSILSAIAEVCKRRDYHLVVTTYDLSMLNNFIIPVNIWQRNVDGLIAAGATDLTVIRKIQDTGTPFVIIGGDYPDDVLSLKSDSYSTLLKIIAYLYRLGHRKLLVPYHYQDTMTVYQQALRTLKMDQRYHDLELCLAFYSAVDEFIDGEIFAEGWLHQLEPPTALIANDQFCTGFLRHLLRHGKRCPDHISIVASDSALSRQGIIPLTATDDLLYETGTTAAENLLDLLEGRKSREEVRQAFLAFYRAGELIMRDSTGPVPGTSAGQRATAVNED